MASAGITRRPEVRAKRHACFLIRVMAVPPPRVALLRLQQNVGMKAPCGNASQAAPPVRMGRAGLPGVAAPTAARPLSCPRAVGRLAFMRGVPWLPGERDGGEQR